MSLYSIDRFDDSSALAVWDINETQENLIKILSDNLVDVNDILSTSNHKRQLERLAVRALSIILWGSYQNIYYDENNRPFLNNFSGDISISHSGRFACIYMHKHMYVGVDVESLSRNFYAVENRVLSSYEKSYLEDDIKQKQLCLIWSAKEAIFKVMKLQNINFKEDIEIKKFLPEKEAKLYGVFSKKNESIKINLELNYKFIDNYSLVWLNRQKNT
jgi:4'-phosphopantetheinyl transferase EntD